ATGSNAMPFEKRGSRGATACRADRIRADRLDEEDPVGDLVRRATQRLLRRAAAAVIGAAAEEMDADNAWGSGDRSDDAGVRRRGKGAGVDGRPQANRLDRATLAAADAGDEVADRAAGVAELRDDAARPVRGVVEPREIGGRSQRCGRVRLVEIEI